MTTAYPLGMSAAEIDRLRRQHETWRSVTETLWRTARFGAGQTVLDLGCGPGFAARDLVNVISPAGRVIAVDASPAATAVLRASATPAEQAALDVITAAAGELDLAGRPLDGVFARWVFCYLPDPLRVLTRIATFLRPGGSMAVLDYWNYLAIRTEPRSERFDRVFAAVHASFRDAGGSLDVAGPLARALPALGFDDLQVTPIAAVGPAGSPVFRWIDDFQALYLPALVERGYLSAGEADAYRAWWREFERMPGAFVFAPPMLAVVARKRADRA